jgi:Fe(3+) dicitrate transport protein
MMRSFALWLCLFGWSALPALAQEGILKGTLRDPEGRPVSFFRISLLENAFVTETDSAGQFQLGPLPYGNYHLRTQEADSGAYLKPFQLQNPVQVQTWQIRGRFRNLKEVEVSGPGQDQFLSRSLRAVDQFGIYEGRKTEVVQLRSIQANLATNNARQVFGKVTGLNIWESDGAGLQLGVGGRGLSPNRTANFNVRQNGYDISADALGYPESYYTPPTEALEQIEVVRGAASLQYGTQFGGLLNFRFRKGPENQKLELTTRQTVGSWGFFNSFTSVGGKVGKLRYYAYGQFKRGDGYRPNSGFRYGNAFASLQYQASESWLLELELTQMHYQAKQAGGLTDRNFQDNPRQSLRSRNWFQVDWNMLALMATHRFSSRTQLNIRNFGLWASRSALGNLERINVVDFGGNRTLIEGQFKNLGNETRLLHRYRIPKLGMQTLLVGSRLYLGQTTARQGAASSGTGADFRFLESGANQSDYRFPNQNLALFAENIVQVSESFTLTPGLRWESIRTGADGHYFIRTLDAAGNEIAVSRRDEERERNRSFLLAGLGISWKVDTVLDIYANVSQNYRALNFSDLRIENPNLVVDTNLRDEKGFTADLGLRARKPGLYSLEITGFYLYYEGKIGQVLRSDRAPLYNDYRFRSNIADARNVGLEMFAELDWLAALRKWQGLERTTDLRLSTYVNLAFVDARYVGTQDPTIRNKKVEMVPPYMLRTGLSLAWTHFQIGLQWSSIGRHYSDATNAIRSATAVEGIIPAYQVADLSARYTWRRFLLELSVNNLTNESYFTRRADGYPGPGIIPSDGRAVYATLGYRW